MNFPKVFFGNNQIIYEITDSDFNIQLSNFIKKKLNQATNNQATNNQATNNQATNNQSTNNNQATNNQAEYENLHNILYNNNCSYKLLVELLPFYKINPYNENQKSIKYSNVIIENNLLKFNIFYSESVKNIYPTGNYLIKFNDQNVELEIITCSKNYFLFFNNINNYIINCVNYSGIVIDEEYYKKLTTFNNNELIKDFNELIKDFNDYQYINSNLLIDLILIHTDYNSLFNLYKKLLLELNINYINTKIIDILNIYAQKHIRNVLDKYPQEQIEKYIEYFISLRTYGTKYIIEELDSLEYYKINCKIINNYIEFGNIIKDKLYLIKGFIVL